MSGNPMTTEAQTTQILAHLKSGKTITPLEALAKFGCFRLGARIFDLRQDGHLIHRDMVRDDVTGKHWAEYSMESRNG